MFQKFLRKKNKNKKKEKTITIVSSGHGALDTLLFYRYAKTLSKKGKYKVTLIARDNQDKIIDGIRIRAIKDSKNRIVRFTLTNFKIFCWCLKKPSSIYMLVTPDLLIIGLILKFFFKRRVIYCALENYADKMYAKSWIPAKIRSYICWILVQMESFVSKLLDAVIVVDSYTKRRFVMSKRLVLLPNYPLFEPLIKNIKPKRNVYKDGKFKMVFIGGISIARGLETMLNILKSLEKEYEIHLYGLISGTKSMKIINESDRFIYHGAIQPPQVISTFSIYDVGLCFYEKSLGYEHAGENSQKFFEYMAAGIPIICSNFPKFKEIVEGENAGITVENNDYKTIASFIISLKKDEKLRKLLGENGRKAIKEKFNWEICEHSLIELCKEIVG